MASGPDKGKFVHITPDGTPAAISQPNRYGHLPIGEDYELERTLIVKIHGAVDGSIGDYSWRDNYVVTEDHYIDYLSRSPIESLVPVQVLDKLRESHCLFLGYTVRDWNLRVFLKRIWEGSLGAKSWAVEPDPDILEKDFWGQSNVELRAADLSDYVATAVRAVDRADISGCGAVTAVDTVREAAASESPYVGLNFFTQENAAMFFGRDSERTVLISNLRASRLTLLYAQSGAGKSSLLRAGVASRLTELAERGYSQRGTARNIPVVFSSWQDDPTNRLIGEIHAAIGRILDAPPPGQKAKDADDDEEEAGALYQAIKSANSATDASLLLILDQFEEYFLYRARRRT